MSNGYADPYEVFAEASDLVDQSILLIRKALRTSPSPEDRRRLDDELLDLERQSALIEAKLDALFEPGAAIPMPTPLQVDAIGELAAEVERHTNQAAAASGTVALTGRVLALAQQISG